MTLRVDSSQSGMGAAILQEGRPIAYASRALAEAETRYAQIEKELLAIVFGTEKFYQYIYGRLTAVQTDHKPLESIFKKPLNKIAPREAPDNDATSSEVWRQLKCVLGSW